jgi:hypothetical protein
MQSNHGFRPVTSAQHPFPPQRRGLRHRNTAEDASTKYWDPIDPPVTTPPPIVRPRIDCGESPLVMLQTGCPCFDLATLTSQMDLKSDEYCNLYASKPVDENDPCKHLYPPSYAYFSASAPYTDTESFSIYFGVESHYDPETDGGYCHGEIYDSFYASDATAGDSSESHSFFLGKELTQTELVACQAVFEELKNELVDDPNCLIEIGSYYY